MQPIDCNTEQINRYNLRVKRTHLFLLEPVGASLKALSEKTRLLVTEPIPRAIDAYLKKV